MKDLKVVFMGTPEFSVPVLQKLIDNTNVVLVVTQPDKEVGRKHILTSTPVKELAIKNNIKVFQPTKIRNDYEEVLNAHPDIVITCAYGQIIPKEILQYPEYSCINVHASLLPLHRGGAPIHHAIINGDEKTGITIMYMDETMDTGDIINSKEIAITDEDNVETLFNKLSILGADLLINTLPKIIDNTNFALKQDNELATYSYNITREDQHIDFNKTSREVFNRVRGVYPFAYTYIDNNEVKILSCTIGKKISNLSPGTIAVLNKKQLGIQTIDGIIYLEKVKPFGKNTMNIVDYINGINKENIINTIVK